MKNSDMNAFKEANKVTKLNITKSERNRQKREYKKFIKAISQPSSKFVTTTIQEKPKDDF